jgi:hypothetical protein
MGTKLRVPVEQSFAWQLPVISVVIATPPVSPSKGDRYIVPSGATGKWAGETGNIVWYDGSQWDFDVPSAGWILFNKDDDFLYYYNDAAWHVLVYTSTVGAGFVGQVVIDFGALPVSEMAFVIVDSRITPTTPMIGQIPYLAPPGKDLDELEMDQIDVKCSSESGQFTAYVRTFDGSYLHDKFYLNYHGD